MEAPTEVTIWASQLEAGHLPGVCIKTGEPTSHRMKLRLGTLPSWLRVLGVPATVSGILFLVGFHMIPGLVVTFPGWLLLLAILSLPLLMFHFFMVIVTLISKTVTGRIPFKGEIVSRLMIMKWSMVGGLLGVGFLVFGGAILGPILVVVVGLLVIPAIGIGIMFQITAPRAVVHRPPGATDKLVVIRDVHPNFAHALAAMQAPPTPGPNQDQNG